MDFTARRCGPRDERTMRRRASFTLVETLAAVALLSLLACAIVPVIQHLAHGDRALRDRYEGRLYITHLGRSLKPTVKAEPVEGHPGWWVRCDELSDDAAAPLQDHSQDLTIAHQWHQILLMSGPDRSDGVIADALIFVPITASPR